MEQIRKSGFSMIVWASFILPGATADRDDVPNLDDMAEETTQGGKTFANPMENPVFVERMRGVIQDAIQFGWI